MKTKTKSLAQLIKDCKFDWVNPNIETNFKTEDVRGEFKVFHFGRYISSKDAVKEIEKEGYLPANLTELLSYAKDGWNDTDWVVALGSVAEVDSSRRVPYLYRYAARRDLYLTWWNVG